MAHEAPRREQPQSRARAATADDDNVLRHSQPVPSTPRTCQLTRHRGPSPREHPRVGDTCCKHAPAPPERPPPRSNGVVCWGFFFMDLQIILYFSAVSLRSAFLAWDQVPAPAASVTHPGRQRSGKGRIARAGKQTPRLFRARQSAVAAAAVSPCRWEG